MNTVQRSEAICGLVAALLGFFSLVYVLFGPIYQSASNLGASGTENLIQAGVQPITFLAFGLFLLALIGESICALQHSRTRRNAWRLGLWASTLVMVTFTLLTLPSIGLFLLPSILFALAASVLAFFNARRAVLS